jgi:hypothetical protein
MSRAEYILVHSKLGAWFALLGLIAYFPKLSVGAEPAPTTAPASQPTLDKILEDLSKLDPKVLVDRLAAMQAQTKKLAEENVALKAKAAANEAEIAKLGVHLNLLEALVKARGMPVPSAPAAPAPPASTAKAMAAPAPAPAPAAAPVAMTAPPKPAPQAVLINYTDHILPIVNEKCAGCHNPDKARGGLVLVTYNDAMNGGGSGKVITPGSADSSRLFRLVSHLEEPHMPPMSSKLDDAKLSLIKQWIDGGAPIDKNAKPMIKAENKPAQPTSLAKVDTDLAPMPTDLPKGPIKKQLHALAASAIAVSPVADLLAVGSNEQIIYYNAKTREPLGVLDYPEGRVEHLAFSKDGTWLIAAGGQVGKSGNVVVFDVETGQRTGEFDKHYDTVLAAAASPDNGMIAVGGTNAKVRVFDAFSKAKMYEIAAHNDWINAVEFSPDGLLLATADRAGVICIWESDTGREVHTIRGHTGAVTALSFRADSQVLASSGKDGTVRLWYMENGLQIRQWPAHAMATLWVQYASDGRIASCGADGFTRLWDQSNGQKLREFSDQGDWIYRVAFTPDSKELIAGAFTGVLAMYEADTGKLLGRLSTAP